MENLQNLVENSITLTQVKSQSIDLTPTTFPLSEIIDDILAA
jgi:hypothetical protein